MYQYRDIYVKGISSVTSYYVKYLQGRLPSAAGNDSKVETHSHKFNREHSPYVQHFRRSDSQRSDRESLNLMYSLTADCQIK